MSAALQRHEEVVRRCGIFVKRKGAISGGIGPAGDGASIFAFESKSSELSESGLLPAEELEKILKKRLILVTVSVILAL